MNSPWFPFHPGEWLVAAAADNLTLAEEGFLLRLHILCWLDPNCSLPNDEESISWMSNNKKLFLKSKCKILKRFAPHPVLPDRLTIPTLYESMISANNRTDKARQNAMARWMRAQCGRNAGAMLGEERREEKTPIVPADAWREGTIEEPKAKTPRTPKITSIPFADFWIIYPRKAAKASAEKAWIKLSPDQTLFDRICDALSAQRESEQWRGDGGRFIPHPATWLNQKRWEDSGQEDNGGSHRPARTAADFQAELTALENAPRRKPRFSPDEIKQIKERQENERKQREQRDEAAAKS